MTLTECRDCPDCGTPVMRYASRWRQRRGPSPGAHFESGGMSMPGGPGWLEYTRTGHRVWAVHSSTRCAYVAAQPAHLRATSFGEPIRGAG